jgi:hypothetical protein
MQINVMDDIINIKLLDGIYLFAHPKFINKAKKIKELLKNENNKNYTSNILSFIFKIIKNIVIFRDKKELEEMEKKYREIIRSEIVEKCEFSNEVLTIKLRDNKKEINKEILKLIYKYFILKEGINLVIISSEIKENLLFTILTVNAYFNAFKVIGNNFDISTTFINNEVYYTIKH